MGFSIKPKFRASELDRVLTCHASKLISSILPPTESTGAALEGNWCHWTAARQLVDEQGATIGEGGLPDTPECDDFKPNGFSEFVVDYFVSEVVWETEGMSIIVEDSLAVEFPNFRLTGHSDVLAFSADGKIAKGWDLKAGAIPVDPAEENNQMLAYMVLAYLCYPGLEEIHWSICQPKNNEDEGFERVSTVSVIGRDKLQALVDYLDRALNAVLRNPNFINSDDNCGAQCKYCPAAFAAKCPALIHDLTEMKATLDAKAIAAISPELCLSELIFFDDARKKFATPFVEVTKTLKAKLLTEPDQRYVAEDGRTFFIHEQNGIRKWHDPVGALKHLKTMELPNEDELLTINLGQLEKAIAKDREIPISGKKDVTGKTVTADEFGAFYEQPTNQLIKVK